MSSETHSDPFEEYSSPNKQPSPPPPPPARGRPTKKKWPWIVGIVALILALGTTGVTLAYSNNTEKLSEYETAHAELQEHNEAALELLETAGALEPDAQDNLSALVTSNSGLLEADAPGVFSMNIQQRTDELLESREALDEPVSTLDEAIGDRSDYNTAVSDGEELLEDAQEVLDAVDKSEVLDETGYSDLSEQTTSLEEALESTPDETSGAAYAEHAKTISTAYEGMGSATEAVSTSHEDWVEKEEQAAKRDPDNYKTISERDWQLVERDPDSHEGEQYVIYGVVTQADANMGGISIRVNTSPEQQSRRYNYDINTMVMAGDLDAFSDVVQDDHVKMLLEVTGSMTYDTTIGGSATAVMGTAYDVEVIGQF